MLNVPMEGLRIKFMVLTMTSVDDRIVIGLAMVDFSGCLMVLLRVDAPTVHRGTLLRYIVGCGGDNRFLIGDCWIDPMITVEVARAIVMSEGVLLAV